jgi:hypothetical protein
MRVAATFLPWYEIVADAEVSLGTSQPLGQYRFGPAPFRQLRIPVLLLLSPESPWDLCVRPLYATVCHRCTSGHSS